MGNRMDVYLNLVDAVQEYVQTVSGDDQYARDWVLACGIAAVDGNNPGTTEIRTISSPGMPAYTATGLLGWALDTYRPSEYEDDESV